MLWHNAVVLVGKPARSCKDFISQPIDNVTLRQVYYLIKDYERGYLDNKLG